MLGSLIAMVAMDTTQPAIQRYNSTKNVNHARGSSLLASPLTILLTLLCTFSGLVIYAYYDMVGCDPLRTGQVKNASQLLPYFIVNVLQVPGLPGVFVATLFSGALSSASSSMNSVAAITWKDFLEERYHHVSEERKTLINKILAASCGVFGTAFAFAPQYFGGHVLQISGSMLGAASVPLLSIILLGTFFPRVHWLAVLLGGILSFVVSLTISMGFNLQYPHISKLNTTVVNCEIFNQTVIRDNIIHDRPGVFPLFKMSFHLIQAFGITICMVTSLLFSLIPVKQRKVPEHLLISVCDSLFCYLPSSFRRSCWRKWYGETVTSPEQLLKESEEPTKSSGDSGSEIKNDSSELFTKM